MTWGSLGGAKPVVGRGGRQPHDLALEPRIENGVELGWWCRRCKAVVRTESAAPDLRLRVVPAVCR